MRTERKLLGRDRGMLVVYGLGLIGVGCLYPLLFSDIAGQLALAMFLCVTMQKQWAAESVAGEREQRTLETLLSSPVRTRTVLLGKALFQLLCACAYAAAMACCIGIVRHLSDAPVQLTPASAALAAAAALCVLLLTACYGVLCSARAETVQRAGRGPTFVCYLFSLLFVVLLSALEIEVGVPALARGVIAGTFFLAAGSVTIYALLRLLRLRRPDIIEVERRAAPMARRRERALSARPRSQAWSVFAHELHYLKTLRMLLLQFFLLMLCPAGLQYTLWLNLGINDLRYAVLLTILLMPRIPANLIAYSVGGEKAYGTGESLLSTSVSVSALFWGKAAVPCLVSVVLLLGSAALNVSVAGVFARLDGTPAPFYTAGQLVLLIGVGLATSFVMIQISAILSLRAQTPRKGLHLSTLLGPVFFLPATAIAMLAGDSLALSVAYGAVLLGACVALQGWLRRVSRAELMARL